MAQDEKPPEPDGSVLLSNLEAEDRAILLNKGAKRQYRSGEVIFARGDEGDSLFVVSEGRVEISITAMTGRKSVLNHMGPGEVLGEVAMFDSGTRSADAIAATRVI